MSDPTQQPPSDPYRPQDPYQPQAPYQGPGGPTPPPQGPYGQPQPPYGQPQPMFSHAPTPNHPQATTAMVLGIISVVGGFMCLVPLLVAPVAWIMGSKAVKEIDASGGRLGGRGEAQTGFITGIVGTVLLVLAVIGIVLFVVLVIVAADSSSGGDYSYDALAALGSIAR
ncbi:MAG: DUF4190 domain-containing protein [Aeromicrobium sp.]|uniref:DUF4190 domain-containing protein n=1 Tax=Aeromicrobium sp. TaxID=1871063 RepID=UPI0025C49C01|nr:DUF4190 domain-containing protein [Aeromicrobium sp.]MCK5891381.1 DUF4190 domain-containing protein [Aeromicrobium sp.]MDF1704473.1 DUF4190 domain-containing protein [Aeromicrobium sp.]